MPCVKLVEPDDYAYQRMFAGSKSETHHSMSELAVLSDLKGTKDGHDAVHVFLTLYISGTLYLLSPDCLYENTIFLH